MNNKLKWWQCAIMFEVIGIIIVMVFEIAFMSGVKHVLNDSEFWVTSFEEPNEEYDYEFYIHLDGKTYTRYGYIG